MAALVVVAGAADLHDGLERHARCLIHGELIHLSADESAELQVTVDSGEVAQPLLEGSHGDRDHEHCGFYLLGRDPLVVPSPVVVLAPEPGGAKPVDFGHERTAATESLYLTAPKTSPPA